MRVFSASYDLAIRPVSYDFIAWLIRARYEANRAQCTHLHVVIQPKDGGGARYWGGYDEAATQWRLWHILVPACALIGATVTVAAIRDICQDMPEDGKAWWSENKRDHVVASLVELAAFSRSMPKLQATAAARRYVQTFLNTKIGPFATITVRQLTAGVERNGRRHDLHEFQYFLEGQGYKVFWLDDTSTALAEGRGYAELDIDLRLALYEAAALNIVGNNGPAALLEHSNAPCIRMGGGQVPDWEQNHGLKHGEQLPWARPDQLIWYGPDTFDELKKAYAQWAGATK